MKLLFNASLIAVGLLWSAVASAGAQTVTYMIPIPDLPLEAPLIPLNQLNTAGTLTGSSGSFGQDGTGPLSVLTDGSSGGVNDPSTWTGIGSGSTLTYALDTTTHPAGYNVTGIDLFSGWSDFSHGNIANVTVAVEYGGGSTFSTLLDGASIVNQNYTGGGSGVWEDVNYSNGSSVLASNVQAVEFIFGAQPNGYVGYREIDIEGSPVSVPEPANGLFVAGLALVFALRNWKRRTRLV